MAGDAGVEGPTDRDGVGSGGRSSGSSSTSGTRNRSQPAWILSGAYCRESGSSEGWFVLFQKAMLRAVVRNIRAIEFNVSPGRTV